MNVLSLFDGISCGRIALQNAGHAVENYIASEIEAGPMSIAKKNFPDTIFAGDVSKLYYIDGVLYKRGPANSEIIFTGKIDLIIGGSPCQGFSYAGLQLNFNDPRSKLFFEFVRLYNEIKVDNSDALFFLENVCMKIEYQRIITKYLDGAIPVYINSGLVSAQSRKRLYWTNIRGGQIPQPKNTGLFLKDILLSEVSDKYFISDRMQQGFKNRLVANKKRGAGFGHKLCTGRDKANTIPARYYKDGKECLIDCGARWRRLTPVEVERLQNVPDNYTEGVSDNNRYKALGNGWNVNTITHFFNYI